MDVVKEQMHHFLLALAACTSPAASFARVLAADLVAVYQQFDKVSMRLDSDARGFACRQLKSHRSIAA